MCASVTSRGLPSGPSVLSHAPEEAAVKTPRTRASFSTSHSPSPESAPPHCVCRPLAKRLAVAQLFTYKGTFNSHSRGPQTVEGMCMRFDNVKIEILIGRNKMTRKIGQEVKKMSAKYVPDIRLNTDIRASAIK